MPEAAYHLQAPYEPAAQRGVRCADVCLKDRIKGGNVIFLEGKGERIVLDEQRKR
jgi:hypothetical protein